MTGRGGVVLASISAVALMLTGCSVPTYGAVRLNADGTVDITVCNRGEPVIFVDYLIENEDPSSEDPPEWTANPAGDGARLPDVVVYGRTPPGYASDAPAAPPPAGWSEVVTTAGSFDADELRVGRWFWNSGGGWNWIPEGMTPCTGYEIGPDGNPRRVS